MTRQNLARPKHYKPEPGDEFIRLRDIGEEHAGRIFEARNQTDGTGIIGYLEDANFYLLQDTVAIRFRGEKLGMFDVPDALILLKAEGTQLPEIEP